MRKENAKFDTKFISEPGSYLVNSDYFAFVELKDYACYVIADGIDSDEKKESAKLAVTTVITEFSDAPGMSKGKLKRYLKAAHDALIKEADEIRLEASIVILLTDYKKVIWGHAGNARLLWIKNGAIKMATKDTSLTQRMVDQEEVALDQLSMHEERNNLYTYLGQPGRMIPVISKKKKLEDGDIILLITRGVWESVGDAEIIDAVDGVSKAEDVCTGLEDVILSQRRDIIENYSIASVFVNKIYQNPKAGKYKRILKIFLGIFFALMMILITLSVASCRKTQKSMEKIEKYKVDGIEYLTGKSYDNADQQFREAYKIAEDIRVRKNSKNSVKVELVKKYRKMTEKITDGLNAIEEEEYKTASDAFDDAMAIVSELKESMPDEVKSYESNIRQYQKFANNIYQGTEFYEKKKYSKAAECFETAKKAMKKVNDNAKRDLADELYNTVAAKQALNEGQEYEKSGDEYELIGRNNADIETSSYEKAINEYGKALESFKNAVSKGNLEAQESVERVTTKLQSLQTLVDSKTDEAKVNDAKNLIQSGKDKAASGDSAGAKADWEEADAKLRSVKTMDVSDLLGEVREKLGNVDEDPEKELLEAIRYMSGGDFTKAKNNLDNVKKIYSGMGDETKAKEIQQYIDAIDKLLAEQAAQAAASAG